MVVSVTGRVRSGWRAKTGRFRPELVLEKSGFTCCDELKFIQIVRVTLKGSNRPVAWWNSTRWQIDGDGGLYYPHQFSSTPPSIQPHVAFRDSPYQQFKSKMWGVFPWQLTRIEFEFESCVMCHSGLEGYGVNTGITFYGCLKWGFYFAGVVGDAREDYWAMKWVRGESNHVVIGDYLKDASVPLWSIRDRGRGPSTTFLQTLAWAGHGAGW